MNVMTMVSKIVNVWSERVCGIFLSSAIEQMYIIKIKLYLLTRVAVKSEREKKKENHG